MKPSDHPPLPRWAAGAAIVVSALLSACGGGSGGTTTPTTGTTTTTASATLHWTAPTQNSDGSPLTDLAGYRIVYGQDANNLSQTVTVADRTATSHVVSGLSSGTWYFAISAYNQAGNSSERSNVASVTK